MPVEPATLGIFAIAVLAVVISPGPDTMLILRHSLTSGRAAGLAAVAGVQLGIAAHTLLAVLGLSLLIASTPLLFRTVGIAGAAYLGWLGVQGLRDRGVETVTNDGRRAGLARACREAFFTNLLNPKVIMLFLALFPQFVERGRTDTTAQLLTLALTLLVINILWQAPIPLAAATLRRWMAAPDVQKRVSQTTGAILLAFGLLMLYEQLV
jgi:homoserine/homoserine lactone efflux protein